MDAKARFNELRSELGAPLDEIARMLGMSYGTLKAYGSASRPEMVPPADLLEAMERTALQAAIDRCRASGLEVIRRRAA